MADYAFTEDWETGDFSNWAVWGPGSATVAVTGSPVHGGSYAFALDNAFDFPADTWPVHMIPSGYLGFEGEYDVRVSIDTYIYVPDNGPVQIGYPAMVSSTAGLNPASDFPPFAGGVVILAQDGILYINPGVSGIAAATATQDAWHRLYHALSVGADDRVRYTVALNGIVVQDVISDGGADYTPPAGITFGHTGFPNEIFFDDMEIATTEEDWILTPTGQLDHIMSY